MNRNTTIALVIVFGALLLYVLLVQAPKDRAVAEATPTPPASTSRLWEAPADQVREAWVKETFGGRQVAFSQDALGAWSVTAPEAGPADPMLVDNALAQLGGLYVSRTITDAADLSAYGVLSPTHTFSVRLADGTQLEAAVGDKTPTGSGYYVLRAGQAEVFVVGTSGVDQLIALLDAPPYLVPSPTPEPPQFTLPTVTP